MPVVVKVGARRRRTPSPVKVVQQGGEAEGGVGRVGERAAGVVVVVVVCVVVVVEVEGGGAPLCEER